MLNFKNLYSTGELANIIPDVLLLLANIENVCGIPMTTMKLTILNHYTQLSDKDKRTGRAPQVNMFRV